MSPTMVFILINHSTWCTVYVYKGVPKMPVEQNNLSFFSTRFSEQSFIYHVSFAFLHKSKMDFTHVTLVFGDGGLVEAHKIILAASSLLLGRNWHLHQLIYTRGIGSNILGAFEHWFWDFAYYFLQF